MSGLFNEKGQYVYYSKTAGTIITGNEDGVKHAAMSILCSLPHIGYSIPPAADAGWNGEVGPGPSYLAPGSGGPENDFNNRNRGFMTWNLLHTARMLGGRFNRWKQHLKYGGGLRDVQKVGRPQNWGEKRCDRQADRRGGVASIRRNSGTSSGEASRTKKLASGPACRRLDRGPIQPPAPLDRRCQPRPLRTAILVRDRGISARRLTRVH
ncbi:hypothetical protein H4V99_003291 [Cryobacterium sp. CG_9.6]|nr:hypothetical protein [Cryobacterium sp. CG_9.6]